MLKEKIFLLNLRIIAKHNVEKSQKKFEIFNFYLSKSLEQ